MKTLKKVIAALFVATYLLSTCAVAFAKPPETAEPMYTGISTLACNIDISQNGCASCYGMAINYTGYSTTLRMDLKRDGAAIKSWTTSGSGIVKLDKDYYVLSGHSYRVDVVATVKNSSGTTVGIYTGHTGTVTY